MRARWTLAASIAVLALPARASADEAKRICTDAYEEAQRAKKRSALTEAREHLLMCGGPQCPDAMHADCERWLKEVEASLASVVFQVESTTHVELTDVRVSIDGRAPIVLGGRAIDFDPGSHRVEISAPGYQALTRQLFVSEGQKLRRERVTLSASGESAAASTPESSGGVPVIPEPARKHRSLGAPFVVAASVAALGAAGFTIFGLRARSEDKALGRCEPQCTDSAVQEARRDYLIANVSLGVGAAGLLTAAVLFITAPKQASAARPRNVQLGIHERALGPLLRLRF